MPNIRHSVKELLCTQDGLAGSSPMEDHWKAPRTNSLAAEGEQHVTSPSQDVSGGRTQQTASSPPPKPPPPNHGVLEKILEG